MRHFFPRTTLPVVATLVISVGAIIVLYLSILEEPEEKPTFQLAAYATAQELRSHIQEADTDNDGLLDWEESMWKTDPRRADTDGDGMLDGDEVQAGRSPLVSGAGESATTSVATTTDANVTDSLAKEFFGTYLTLKQSGQLNGETQQELFQSLADRAAERLILESHTLEELTIVPSTPEQKAAYRDALAQAFSPISMLQSSEFELLAKVVANQPHATTSLAETIAAIDTSVDSMLTMPVPEDVAPLHLSFLNALNLYARGVEGIAAIHDDPLRAAASAQIHATADAQLYALQDDLRAYLDSE